jgi:plastocyanin
MELRIIINSSPGGSLRRGPEEPMRVPRTWRCRGGWIGIPLVLGIAVAGLAPGGGRADAPLVFALTIKDHRFEPAEVRVPAGRPFVLQVKNEDATAEEFESRPLELEKVIAGNRTATVRVRPLEKGRYAFFGDYHQATAQGAVVAE